MKTIIIAEFSIRYKKTYFSNTMMMGYNKLLYLDDGLLAIASKIDCNISNEDCLTTRFLTIKRVAT